MSEFAKEHNIFKEAGVQEGLKVLFIKLVPAVEDFFKTEKVASINKLLGNMQTSMMKIREGAVTNRFQFDLPKNMQPTGIVAVSGEVSHAYIELQLPQGTVTFNNEKKGSEYSHFALPDSGSVELGNIEYSEMALLESALKQLAGSKEFQRACEKLTDLEQTIQDICANAYEIAAGFTMNVQDKTDSTLLKGTQELMFKDILHFHSGWAANRFFEISIGGHRHLHRWQFWKEASVNGFDKGFFIDGWRSSKSNRTDIFIAIAEHGKEKDARFAEISISESGVVLNFKVSKIKHDGRTYGLVEDRFNFKVIDLISKMADIIAHIDQYEQPLDSKLLKG